MSDKNRTTDPDEPPRFDSIFQNYRQRVAQYIRPDVVDRDDAELTNPPYQPRPLPQRRPHLHQSDGGTALSVASYGDRVVLEAGSDGHVIGPDDAEYLADALQRAADAARDGGDS